MNFEKLKERCRGKTLLGVGPVSRNVIDITIELANRYDIPIILIPSRRQVECQELGGGYVDNTEDFSHYVRQKDIKGNIILARDHGSVLQGNNEEKLSHEESTQAAIISYESDINNGFDILHIDPSLQKKSLQEIQLDIEKFHSLCEEYLDTIRPGIFPIIYEVGSEEHSSGVTDIKQFEAFAKRMSKLRNVKFIVGNTGTFVRELSNTGNFDQKLVKDMLKICEDNGLWFKEHNLDYTQESILALHPQLGIHSANVAPELGTVETKKIIEQLTKYNLSEEKNRFFNLVNSSYKWKKWMIQNTDNVEYKAKIAGHYLFLNEEFLRIKDKIMSINYDFNNECKKEIEITMLKYLVNFRWVN